MKYDLYEEYTQNVRQPSQGEYSPDDEGLDSGGVSLGISQWKGGPPTTSKHHPSVYTKVLT